MLLLHDINIISHVLGLSYSPVLFRFSIRAAAISENDAMMLDCARAGNSC